MIFCAGNNETFPFAKALGVGLLQPCIKLTKMILTQKIDEIIFIGTMGLYDKNEPLLSIYECNNACNVEISNILELSYSPIENIVKNNDKIIINSSNYITKDSKIAEKFLSFGLFGENMELFSILKVAQYYKIKAKGILCATNHTDENAHKDFVKNHAKAKENLTKYLKNKGLI